MKTRQLAFLAIGLTLAILSSCTKEVPCTTCGTGGTGGTGGTPPEQFGAANCYKAAIASDNKFPVKGAAIMCSSSPGTITVTGCYSQTTSGNLYNNLTYGMAGMLCSGAGKNNSSPGAPVACINNAVNANWFDAATLCSGASYTNAPYQCWMHSDTTLVTGVTEHEAAILCMHSVDNSAIGYNDANDCYASTNKDPSSSNYTLPSIGATLCSQSNEGDYTNGAGYEAVACFNDMRATGLSAADAAVLCQKAKITWTSSTAYTPVTEQCFIDSGSGVTAELYDHEAAILCSGAKTSYGPKTCYENGKNLPLSYEDAAILCSGASGASYNEATKPNRCFVEVRKLSDFANDAHNAAVLCSNNPGLTVALQSEVYHSNRTVRGGETREQAPRQGGGGGRVALAARTRSARASYIAEVSSPAYKAKTRAGAKFMIARTRREMDQILSSSGSRGNGRDTGHTDRKP